MAARLLEAKVIRGRREDTGPAWVPRIPGMRRGRSPARPPFYFFIGRLGSGRKKTGGDAAGQEQVGRVGGLTCGSIPSPGPWVGARGPWPERRVACRDR